MAHPSRSLFSFGLILASLVGSSVSAQTYWTDLRRSALLPGDEITVRVENPHGSGITNEILYDEGGIQSTSLTLVPDGPSTVEASVPAPLSGSRSYGFRLTQDDDLDILAVQLENGGNPSPEDLTELATDPTGDEAFGRTNLDLTGCRIARDDTRLYAALSNAGEGFPVNSGLTFFSYLLGINNPAVADPDTVFAMIQTVSVAGIIEPGLYQINGTGVDDLQKIGDITATEFPGSNTLVLSCLLSDLESNPVFQSWYNPIDPRIGVAAFSQKITLSGGVDDADQTDGGIWHLREVALLEETNLLPELADLDVPAPGANLPVRVQYSDGNANCPVLSELRIDGVPYPLRPVSLDYTQAVRYASAAGLPPVEDDSWTTLIARFSDNVNDIIELEATTSSVFDSPPTTLDLTTSPNPFRELSMLSFRLYESQRIELSVFDMQGRQVALLASDVLPAGAHTYQWDGRNGSGRSVAAGVYLCRLRTADTVAVRRVTRQAE